MNHTTPKVTVVGSLNVDLVCHATRRPDKGETLIGDAFDIFTGGKGFNQATAAARLGAEVTLIGSVGADPFGEMLLAAVENEHINSRFVTRRTRHRHRCSNNRRLNRMATIALSSCRAPIWHSRSADIDAACRLDRRGGCAPPTIGDSDCRI